MSQGLDSTLIVFALIAVFVLWKLRSVLGTRVDIDKRPEANKSPLPGADTKAGPAQNSAYGQTSSNVVRLPGAEGRAGALARNVEVYAKTPKARQGLLDICAADRNFDVRKFLDGAASAYKMIVEAFASGARATLSSLLAPHVFSNFEAEIARREAASEKAGVRIHGIDTMEVADAQLLGREAQITVKIEAKMSNSIIDRAGAVISGDPDLIVTTSELWTFARNLDANDPNWRLIATESVAQP